MPSTIPTTDHPGESFTAASTPGIAVNQLRLNHPKNYVAVPLAVAADGDSDALINEYAVSAVHDARRGAVELNLITEAGDRTPLGDAVVVSGTNAYGSIENALAAIRDARRSHTRFREEFSAWRTHAERLAFQYDPTTYLVQFLREQGTLRLHELTWLLWKHDPELAETVFLNRRVTTSNPVTPGNRPASRELTNPGMYRAEATFQYKAFLYHCGILTDRGADSARLDPETDTWTLNPALR